MKPQGNLRGSVTVETFNSGGELEDTVTSALRGIRKGLAGESIAEKAYQKVGERGVVDMLKPVFKADLTVDETEQLFEVLKVIIKRAKIRSVFAESQTDKTNEQGGDEHGR